MKEENFLVIGAARSGIAMSNTLIELGKNVILYDSNMSIEKEKIKESIHPKVQLFFGSEVDVSSLLSQIEIMVLSPGVPTDLPFISIAEEKGIKVVGEIELNYVLCKSKDKIIGITGTNGKTTTTSLVYEIVKAYDSKTLALGNIGTPFSKEVLRIKEENIILELSSFQLETIDTFKAHVSAVLNITPDHLDRHKTMENYVKAKENVFKNQTEKDFVIFNYEDICTREMAEKTKANVYFFSSASALEKGAFLRGEDIILKENGTETKMCNIHDLKIIGMHNVENAMAAILITYVYGVPIDIIQKVLLTFNPVEHRIEYVRTLHGVKYYNDSKGTNPDSSIKAIRAMKGDTIIIIGGYDKKMNFDEFIQEFDGKVKLAIIIGEVKKQLVETCEKFAFKDYVCKETFEEAVLYAYENAKEGDSVLLSPACASWDMFSDYEERGRVFKEIVNKF